MSFGLFIWSSKISIRNSFAYTYAMLLYYFVKYHRLSKNPTNFDNLAIFALFDDQIKNFYKIHIKVH